MWTLLISMFLWLQIGWFSVFLIRKIKKADDLKNQYSYSDIEYWQYFHVADFFYYLLGTIFAPIAFLFLMLTLLIDGPTPKLWKHKK